ncbi:phage tail protein [Gracilibacillus caseinilyticus]|uniref:Phage tail protein n=1 Tax=Gracilibacillus caseinilyticus TaxID=2932256 RepID=A0ABY4EU18_9BACI|nr:phage tail protein [Gracilibacillus caseinilyticus]UOQ47764.1 phage tail protein [Gracilibacillus caseinilyticus]
MTRFTIDSNKPIPELELSLHRPDGTQIENLTDAYDRTGTFKFGDFKELEITIPKYVHRKHQKVKYKPFELARDKYLVKATYGNMFSEYLIVTKIKKSKSAMPVKQLSLKSRQYELNNKIIRTVESGSRTVDELINIAVTSTNWTLDHVDTEFLNQKRSFDETKITSLNLLYKIAESFGGVLSFDTFNRTVSIYTPENMQYDYGLSASYGKYIKSLEDQTDAESVITRLYVYGKDGLSISDVQPTGNEYIEDFSHYLKGYEVDNNGNVISSSPYMSDGLCQAIIDYNNLIQSKQAEYDSLIEERQPFMEQLNPLLDDMEELQEEYEKILDDIDTAKANEEDTNELINNLNNKQSEIDDKQVEIYAIEEEMSDIQDAIETIHNELSEENNFTSEQLKEKEIFVVEDVWEDNRYTVVEELYNAAVKKLNANKEPQRELKFSLIQFLKVIDAQNDWDRIGLGYVFRADYEPLDVEFKSIISEMKIGFDSNSLDLTVSNVVYSDSKEKFAELIYNNAVSTSNKLNKNESKWNESSEKTTELDKMMQENIELTNKKIVAGADQSVTVDRRGIKIRNPKNEEEVIILQSGVIALSEDGSETWGTALDAKGIRAEKILGRLLAGENLVIENDGGTVRIDEDGIDVINGNIAIINNDGQSRVIINPIDGIRIQKNDGNAWVDSFFADESGDLSISGNFYVNGGEVNWSNVNKPTYTSDDIDALPADSPKISKLSDTGQYTGNVTPSQVESGSFGNKTFTDGTFNDSEINNSDISNSNIENNESIDNITYLMHLFSDEFHLENVDNNTYTTVKPGLITIADSNNNLELKPDGVYVNGVKEV